MFVIFPPNLTSASALPGETGYLEIASFHLNAACFFTKKAKQLKISPGQSQPPFTVKTINCMGAPDRT